MLTLISPPFLAMTLTYGLGLVFLGRLAWLLRFVLGGGYPIFHHASIKLLPFGLLLWVGERKH